MKKLSIKKIKDGVSISYKDETFNVIDYDDTYEVTYQNTYYICDTLTEVAEYINQKLHSKYGIDVVMSIKDLARYF